MAGASVRDGVIAGRRTCHRMSRGVTGPQGVGSGPDSIPWKPAASTTTSTGPMNLNVGKIKPSDLPAPPQAALGIVKACRDPDVGAQQLSNIVTRDPRLTAEVLRTVNSAFFGLDRKIGSASQAVAVLGNRALRNIALCFAVRDATRAEAMKGFDIVEFWEEALRRGVVARSLAARLGLDTEEAFTLGLLQEFGTLAMLHVMPDRLAAWPLVRTALPAQRIAIERENFGTTHTHVGWMLARNWGLPEEIGLAIANHHDDPPTGLDPQALDMCRIARASEMLAAVFGAQDKRQALEDAHEIMAGTPWRLSRGEVDDLLAGMPSAVERVGLALGLSVKDQPSFDTILREANEHLVEANLSYQELIWRLQQVTQALQLANARLEQLAYHDALTGLSNRRHFEEGFLREVVRHSRTGRPLSMVIMDIDKFKVINDSWGHPFGDVVLGNLAAAMQSTLRRSDLKARVGGDEFYVLLPETTDVMGRKAMAQLREAVRGLDLTMGDTQVPVSVSMGGVTWSGRVDGDAGAHALARTLVKRADDALYGVKRAGGDGVGWADDPTWD